VPAVTYTISAKDNTSRAAKSAQKNLAGIGEQAAKAAAGILSVEKARIGLQAVREVAQLGADAFRAMAQNSAAMKGELGAVSSAMGKVAGSLGDTLANSRAFKTVLDTLTAGMKDLEGWINSNAETINDVFAGAVRYAAQSSRALLFTVKGLIDLIVVAKNMVPAAQESTSSLIEGTLHSMRFLGLKARMALTGESTVYRQAEAARLALRAYGAGEGKLGEALNQSESEVTRINAMLDSADALLDRVARGATDPRAGGRATKLASGRAAAAGGLDDSQKALLASQKQYQAMMLAMRAEATNDTNDIAAEALRAEEAAAEASRKIQERALADQRRLNDERIEEARRAAQEQAAILGSLAAGTATALAVALGSGADMVDALFQQIGGALTQLGGTMTASGFAALLAGPAAALFGLPAPGMIAAGLGLTAAGAALQSGLIGGGGSSSSGGGSTVASGYQDTSSQRVQPAQSAAPITYQIVQNFSGVYASEAEAGRKIQDAIYTANRGGTSALRRATSRAY
jgi:hypothetical protein